MRSAQAACAALIGLLLAGCDRNGMGSMAWHTFWEVLWGAPDAQALKASTPFAGEGISFDRPAALREREEADDDGSHSWSFEHGMFELQLAAHRVPLRSADYLGLLGDMFEGGRSLDADGPMPGRTERLCGREVTATRLRLKIAGDWSEMQAFDLPAPPGEARLLVFDDEPVGDSPSPVAQATWSRVIGSLRCDPGFVWPDPIEPASDDAAEADTTADPSPADTDAAPAGSPRQAIRRPAARRRRTVGR